MEPITYSPFERSLYSSQVNTRKNQSILRFALNNTFEIKKRSMHNGVIIEDNLYVIGGVPSSNFRLGSIKSIVSK